MANNLGSLAKELLSSDVLKGISKQTDVSTDDVAGILASALPALLNGANKQATQKSTAESFLQAIQSHGANDTSNITSFLKNVDAEDGAKIISHLLGSSTETVAKDVVKSSKSSIKTGDVVKVLAIAAPLLMNLIAKKSGTKKDSDLSSIVGLLGNKEVASLATSLLGGGKKNDGLDLGDVVGLVGKFLK